MEECDGFSGQERPYLLHCGSGQGIDHEASHLCVLDVLDRRAKPASFQSRGFPLSGANVETRPKIQAVTNMVKMAVAAV
jgi:hypothetical protein